MSSSSTTVSSDTAGGKAARFAPASRIAPYAAPTVWSVFTPLAIKHQAVNLGQGFPGWTPPSFVQRRAAEAVTSDAVMDSQYARVTGYAPLSQQLADTYSQPHVLDRAIDPDAEVCVCNGATETIYCALAGLVDEGDEVVMFEPAFDIYPAQTRQMGGVPVRVPLRVVTDGGDDDGAGAGAQRWSFDIDEFERAFTPRTRVLLLNTPHNPTGKCFTVDELTRIAAVVARHPDVVVVADEVYEHLTFDDERPHVRFATLPGMWERTLSVSSSGKTFSVTGWKIGWAIGPAHLVRCVAMAHTWTVFSVSTPLQRAVSLMLRDADAPYEGHGSYYDWLRTDYRMKRALLLDALTSAGLTPIANEGSFFIMADTSSITLPQRIIDAHPAETRDWQMARYLCMEYGVASIPCSSFYSDDTAHLAANLLRFAFCKPASELKQAKEALCRLRDEAASTPAEK